MTCQNCVQRVQTALQKIAGVQGAQVLLHPVQQATIDSKMPISLQTFKNALAMVGNYDIFTPDTAPTLPTAPKNWWQTYQPILLVFVYLAVVSLLSASFTFELAMRYFMAGFFIVFSFFKMLNINAFAQSYAMYDIVAQKVKIYGKIYPFIELALGLAYLTNFMPLYTNIFAFIIMGISTIGVANALRHRQKIQCACLGTVFELPMSTVTIIENTTMIAMAAMAIIMQLA
jgi:copper chaperone CopZ